MWTGKPVDYSILHSFECPSYVMYNAKERTKVDPKSTRCIVLRYANGVTWYRLWDPIISKVISNRDVVFAEYQLL